MGGCVGNNFCVSFWGQMGKSFVCCSGCVWARVLCVLLRAWAGVCVFLWVYVGKNLCALVSECVGKSFCAR